MTIPRTPGPVSGVRSDSLARAHAWGRTSGAGSPTLDTRSWGTASITDASVGLLDVTFEAGFGGVAYCAIVSVTVSSINLTTKVSNVTVPTAAAIRIVCLNSGATATTLDPDVGYEWVVFGR